MHDAVHVETILGQFLCASANLAEVIPSPLQATSGRRPFVMRTKRFLTVLESFVERYRVRLHAYALLRLEQRRGEDCQLSGQLRHAEIVGLNVET